MVGIWGRHNSVGIDVSYPVSIYATSAVISLIAAMSSIMKILTDYQYMCVDALGVATFASQWASWLVDVPLLAYIAIAMEDKERLEVNDVLVVVAAFLMIMFGYLMNLTTDWNTGMFLCCLSFIAIFYQLYLTIQTNKGYAVKSALLLADGEQETILHRAQWMYERVIMKGRLSWLQVYFLPLFPAVYLGRLAGVVTQDQFLAGNLVCSVLAKLIFVSIISLESMILFLAGRHSLARRSANAQQFPGWKEAFARSLASSRASSRANSRAPSRKNSRNMLSSAQGQQGGDEGDDHHEQMLIAQAAATASAVLEATAAGGGGGGDGSPLPIHAAKHHKRASSRRDMGAVWAGAGAGAGAGGGSATSPETSSGGSGPGLRDNSGSGTGSGGSGSGRRPEGTGTWTGSSGTAVGTGAGASGSRASEWRQNYQYQATLAYDDEEVDGV